MDWKGLRDENFVKSLPLQPKKVKDRGTDLADGVNQLNLQNQNDPVRFDESELIKFSKMAEEGEKLFTAHQWLDAFNCYKELADAFPDDWIYQFRAAVACTAAFGYHNEKEKAVQGEKYVLKANELLPEFHGGFCVLARIYYCTKRYSQNVEIVLKLIELPHYSKEYAWCEDMVADSLRTLQISLRELGRSAEFPNYKEKLMQIYPEAEKKFINVLNENECEELWKKADSFFKVQPINWVAGQQIFSRLAELRPDDYWANLHTGSTHTFGGQPQTLKKGEFHARRAIEIDPLLVCGYGILAKNLQMQGRLLEVIGVMDMMLNCQADGNHVDLAIEGLKSAQIAYQSTGQGEMFEVYVGKFLKVFPFWKPQVEAMRGSCSIM